ncbi:hypothetical protein UZS95_19490 [Parabacteroides goldsteinii]|uniref:hypothetical protein n=1 Tax=Parabacteroides goldsteinii TaxID=328812 RepID=UPI002AB8F87F|nr:hypothetical protein [Parabacteroides goldsteinii]MDZ3928593.1 hypothetical protein [Parabacteroides goldsteinii]
MEQALNPVDWYMKLLAPLSPDIKLDLISKLSESLKDTHTYSKKPHPNLPISSVHYQELGKMILLLKMKSGKSGKAEPVTKLE